MAKHGEAAADTTEAETGEEDSRAIDSPRQTSSRRLSTPQRNREPPVILINAAICKDIDSVSDSKPVTGHPRVRRTIQCTHQAWLHSRSLSSRVHPRGFQSSLCLFEYQTRGIDPQVPNPRQNSEIGVAQPSRPQAPDTSPRSIFAARSHCHTQAVLEVGHRTLVRTDCMQTEFVAQFSQIENGIPIQAILGWSSNPRSD